jgi:hypothetical protein
LALLLILFYVAIFCSILTALCADACLNGQTRLSLLHCRAIHHWSDASMNKVFVTVLIGLILTGCSDDHWHDSTDQHRGNSEFKMDYASCQQVGNDAQTDALTSTNCPDKKCAASTAVASSFVNSGAVDNCLASRGWEKIATVPAPPAHPKPLTQAQRESFHPMPGVTRVFFFAVYSSVADTSWFGTTHRVDVNGHYAGTFSDKQFLEWDTAPGNYTVDVYSYGWLGTLLKHTTSPATIGGPGQDVFVAVAESSESTTLNLVNAEYGIEQVSGRVAAGQ